MCSIKRKIWVELSAKPPDLVHPLSNFTHSCAKSTVESPPSNKKCPWENPLININTVWGLGYGQCFYCSVYQNKHYSTEGGAAFQLCSLHSMAYSKLSNLCSDTWRSRVLLHFTLFRDIHTFKWCLKPLVLCVYTNIYVYTNPVLFTKHSYSFIEYHIFGAPASH